MCSFVQKMKMMVLLVACLVFAAGNAAGQAVLIESNFDTGTEGWTAVTFVRPCKNGISNPAHQPGLTWRSAGGVPGGFLHYLETGNGIADFLRAPAAYHGDLSAVYCGSLTYEQRFVTASSRVFYASDDVYIQSGSMTLIADLPNPSRDS